MLLVASKAGRTQTERVNADRFARYGKPPRLSEALIPLNAKPPERMLGVNQVAPLLEQPVQPLMSSVTRFVAKPQEETDAGVEIRVGVLVRVGEGIGVRVGVCVAGAVGVATGVRVRVAVGAAVPVRVAVRDEVGVKVLVVVGKKMRVRVAEGAAVPVEGAVGIRVRVGVGVIVRVRVGVKLGEGEVGAGERVGVGTPGLRNQGIVVVSPLKNSISIAATAC